MGAIATFDPAAWFARYPEFVDSIAAPQAIAFFAEATLYHANDGSGPVRDTGQQLALLGMVTAHIAALNAGINGEDPSPLVGRVSSASQGSVSVSVDMPDVPVTAAWFAQTKYGIAYWQATARFRTMHYRPMPGRRFL